MPRSLTHPEQIDRIQRADGEAKGHPVSLTPGNDVRLGISPPSRFTFRDDHDRVSYAVGYLGQMARNVADGRCTLSQVASSLRALLGDLS